MPTWFKVAHRILDQDWDKFAPFPKNPAIAKFFIQLGRVKELGSGILNVNKYLAAYSAGSKPEFIEADVFKTIIPLAKDLLKDTTTVNATVNDTVNQLLGDQFSVSAKERFAKIVRIIIGNPGLRSNMIAKELNINEGNIRRDIKKLQQLSFIDFTGTPKTGGYFITDAFKDKLKE